MRTIKNILDAIIYSSIINTPPSTDWRKNMPYSKDDNYANKRGIKKSNL